MNLCSPCGLDFTSVRDFDRHRVGVHAYTYSEGLKMEPPREDGRRCLSLDEMQAAGWSQDRYGRWRKHVRSAPVDVRGLRSKGKKASDEATVHP